MDIINPPIMRDQGSNASLLDQMHPGSRQAAILEPK